MIKQLGPAFGTNYLKIGIIREKVANQQVSCHSRAGGNPE